MAITAFICTWQAGAPMDYALTELREQRRRVDELAKSAEHAHFEARLAESDPCSTLGDIAGAIDAERRARRVYYRERRKLSRGIAAFVRRHRMSPAGSSDPFRMRSSRPRHRP